MSGGATVAATWEGRPSVRQIVITVTCIMEIPGSYPGRGTA
jgi:hypothetical protein